MKRVHLDGMNDDEYYVRTEDPLHLVDIVHSTLELRHHVPTNMYFIAAIIGKQAHILGRYSNKGHCYRVFEELKRIKFGIIKQLRRQNR